MTGYTYTTFLKAEVVMLEDTHMIFRKITIILITALLVGCGTIKPVPEVDADRIEGLRLLKAGKSTELEAKKLLGEPAFIEESSYDIQWIYPTRIYVSSFYQMLHHFTPAPKLKITFNNLSTVTDWNFIHPRTGQPLPVREKLSEADNIREQLCYPPPRIALSEVLRKGSCSKRDVENTFHPYRVYKELTDDGEVWTYYVERPSPLFWPAGGAVLHFSDGVYYALEARGGYSSKPMCDPCFISASAINL
jgi:hypothetical protein